MQRELMTIQEREKLNKVTAIGEKCCANANYLYEINSIDGTIPMAVIQFQKGPRNSDDSDHGVIDSDLLEIVRDRMVGFQSGEFACDYNAMVLKHVEEALSWLNKRVEDRIARNVLGVNAK